MNKELKRGRREKSMDERQERKETLCEPAAVLTGVGIEGQESESIGIHVVIHDESEIIVATR